MRPAIGAAGNSAQRAAGMTEVVDDGLVDVVVGDAGFEELEHAPSASPSAAIETRGPSAAVERMGRVRARGSWSAPSSCAGPLDRAEPPGGRGEKSCSS